MERMRRRRFAGTGARILEHWAAGSHFHARGAWAVPRSGRYAPALITRSSPCHEAGRGYCARAPRMRPTPWKLAPLLFGSGLCALIYQVAWFREFRLVFGASTLATSAVLAI